MSSSTTLDSLVKRVKVGYVGTVDRYYCSPKDGYKIYRPTDITQLGLDESKVRYITKEFYEKNKKSQLKRGDIIISRCGKDGIPVIYDSDEPAQILNAVVIEPDSKKMTSDEIHTFLRSPYAQAQISNYTSGSVQGVINTKMIAALKVPSEVDVSAITKIIKRIDKNILTNTKIIETSENLMREIYDYWFVQFDFPNENSRPYKSFGGEMVYDDKLKREIPKGWKVQNLLRNDLCKDIKPGIDKFENTKTYYATADVIGGEISIGTQIDYANRESRANMQPKPNSVWFAKMKNSVKHITVMPTSNDLLEKSIFSTGFFGLECKPETLPYVRSFIYGDYFEKIKDLNSNGATMEAISNDGIRNIKLIIPDEATLKKYSDITNACLTQNDILRKENAKLTSLRDWLLPMLMSGQVKVAD